LCLCSAAWADGNPSNHPTYSTGAQSTSAQLDYSDVGVDESIFKGDGIVDVSDGAVAGGASNDTCGTAETIACGAVATVNLGPATTTPDEPSFPCRFVPGQGAHNVWYRFSATATSATIRTCGSTGIDSVLAVYSGTCGALTQLACNDDFCAPAGGGNAFVSSVDVTGLVVGTQYYIQLGAYDEAAVGTYSLQVLCPAGSCTVTCPGGSVQETPLHCTAPDPADPNNGCNGTAAPFRFQDITCGQTVCGRGSRPDGANRDTDWYRFQITQPSTVTWSATAEFPVQVNLLSLTGNTCPVAANIIATTAAPCVPATVTTTLNPGFYVAFVAHQATGTTACGATSDYVATLTCTSAVPGACCHLDGTCTVELHPTCQSLHGFYQGDGTACGDVVCCNVPCPPGSVDEGEPLDCLFGPDDFNGGCNSAVFAFNSFAQCNNVYCGTSGTNGATRDTDWWVFTIATETQLTWRLTPEFTASQYLIPIPDPNDPCTAPVITLANEPVLPCTTAEMVACLQPGTYVLFVSSGAVTAAGDRFNPDLTPCGAPYLMEVLCDAPCPTGACCLSDGSCAGITTEPGCTAEGGQFAGAGTTCEADCCSSVAEAGDVREDQLEPDCGLGAAGDTVDGGCNSDPNVFLNINCGDAVYGTSGNDGTLRDTDWYLVNVAAPVDTLTLSIESEFPIVILFGPGGVCPANFTVQITGPRCTAGDIELTNQDINNAAGQIPAGTYMMFVGAGNADGSGIFSGIPCGFHYRIATACGGGGNPCGTQVLGDANCDGVVNNFDIDCFVLALTNPTTWAAQCSNGGACTLPCVADTNGDQAVNNFDIDSFVTCIINQGCP
jgi:hypothetical protein